MSYIIMRVTADIARDLHPNVGAIDRALMEVSGQIEMAATHCRSMRIPINLTKYLVQHDEEEFYRLAEQLWLALVAAGFEVRVLPYKWVHKSGVDRFTVQCKDMSEPNTGNSVEDVCTFLKRTGFKSDIPLKVSW